MVEELEKRYLTQVLKRTGGHLGRAAQHAGIHRKSLYNKLKRYGLSVQDLRDDEGSVALSTMARRAHKAQRMRQRLALALALIAACSSPNLGNGPTTRKAHARAAHHAASTTR